MKLLLGLAVPLAILVGSLASFRPQDPPAPGEPERLVIAHRGASGYLPEHTLEAYALAYGMGVDYIEPDVVFTSDRQLICLHDLYLERTTDVAVRFFDRRRDDRHWYAMDFTLEELQSLRLGRPDGKGYAAASYRIATLADLVRMIDDLNVATGRSVGIIPELKHPAAHREALGEAGTSPEERLAQELDPELAPTLAGRVVYQCFDEDSLRRMRALGRGFSLIYCTSDELGDARLDAIAEFADGIAPSRRRIEPEDGPPTDLVERAHARGLAVYTWTFGDEEEAMRRFYDDHGVDGIFTDYPDAGVRAAGR